MKRSKIFLISLFASTCLFLSAPHACPKLLEDPRIDFRYIGYSNSSENEPTYEQKVERIANYLEEIDRLSILNLNIPSTSYGLHTVVLEKYSEANNEYVSVGLYEKSDLAIFSNPKFFLLVDVKSKTYNSLYGSLDWVVKLDEETEEYVEVYLTKGEKKKFKNMYLKIIEKFYSENETNMEALEKALEQNKEVQELLDILGKK